MEENPSSKTPAVHVFPGGRPPDVATPDVSLPGRERSSSGETNLESSPMLLGDSLDNSNPQDVVVGEQDSSKITSHDSVSTDVVMEAPIVPPSSPNNGSNPVDLQTSPEGLSSDSAGVSYATMVAKNLRNIPRAGGGIVQDKVIVRDDDFVIDRAGMFPSIMFSDRVHEQIDANMSTSVIVHLLGHSIGDYTKVLMEGPWTIYGNYLTVQHWHRSFSTTENHPSRVVVWVRLPGLPYRYYNPALFRHIASVVGRVVRIYDNTAAGGRGRFARIVVLVDLKKPLLSCIGIDVKVQKLEYEGLSQICFGCGVSACFGTNGSDTLWTVDVDSRRRHPSPRQANPSKRVVTNTSHEVEVPGTRFSILAGTDDLGGSESTECIPLAVAKAHNNTSVGKESSGISLNEAYMASNPQKKSKHASRIGLIPDVVPIVDEEDIEVVPHVVNQQPDKHAAVAIVENVPRKAGLVGGKVTKQRGNVGRNFSDARRGLPIRKSTEVWLSNATNVSSWVQDLAQQLSAAKSIGCSSHGLSGVSSELSDKEKFVSASGDGSTVDTGQVSPVTEGASIVQAVMWYMFTSSGSAGYDYGFRGLFPVVPRDRLDLLGILVPLVSNNQPVFWTPPARGWHKLNSDGARRVLNGWASCGGVICDSFGNWCLGFSKFVGICSVVEAELWGVFVGLLCAWNLQLPKLVVEIDSMDALRLLQSNSHQQGVLSVVLHILELCARPWDVRFQFIGRDGNGVADGMAKLASGFNFDLYTFLHPPVEVLDLL
ncbi:hypothetical protein GQ457_16G014900 [Hibiscus cannabinus]